jgi:hypothetical protein
MGYGNLELSALDVGLTAKEAVALSKLPVMRGLAGSDLTPKKWTVSRRCQTLPKLPFQFLKLDSPKTKLNAIAVSD